MLCGKCMLICPRGVETRKMILEMLNYIKTKLKSWNHYYAAIRIHEQNILRSLCPAVHDRSGRATGVLCVRYYKWIKSFPKEERKKIRKGLFSFKTIRSGWEIFRESLLHHNIFKTNPMLGYMHMTFAFGWFLLIVVGKSNLWFIIPALSTHLISLSFSVISIRQKRHSRTASFSRSWWTWYWRSC